MFKEPEEKQDKLNQPNDLPIKHQKIDSTPIPAANKGITENDNK